MKKKISFILFLLLCLLIALLYLVKRTEGFELQGAPVEVVLARYSEPVDWLNSIKELASAPKTIYNKGKPFESNLSNSKIIQLPNVGREGHTYLHHIVNTYERLPEYTLFLQGSTGLVEHKKSELDILLNSMRNGLKTSLVKGFSNKDHLDSLKTFQLDSWASTNKENLKSNGESNLQPAPIRPLGKWIDHHCPGESFQCVSYKGLFLGKREDIQKRPKAFYESLLKELESSSNPEVGHYLERSWHLICSMPKESCLEK